MGPSTQVLYSSFQEVRFVSPKIEMSSVSALKCVRAAKSEFWFDWDFLFFVISWGFWIMTMIMMMMMHQWGSSQIEFDKFVAWQQLSTNFEARLIELYVWVCVCGLSIAIHCSLPSPPPTLFVLPPFPTPCIPRWEQVPFKSHQQR